MTVKPLGNGQYVGLSTDTKPTAASTTVNATFEETDTGKVYKNSGSAWVGYSPSIYGGRTKVYKIGSTYYAEKYDGTIISASGTFETVLQAALDLQGLVRIDQDGVFQFSSVGCNIPTFTELIMGRNTHLRVPVSSSNFKALQIGTIGPGTTNTKEFCTIRGGVIDHASPNTWDWYGIRLQALKTNDGIFWPVIEDTVVIAPYSAVLFETSFEAGTPDKLGAITSGYFKNVTAYSPVAGFNWMNSGGKGTTRCVFEACTVQAHVGPPSQTTYGFYNVQTSNIAFRDCVVWDMNILTNPTQRTMVVNADASSIKIEGGTIARQFHISPGDNVPHFVNHMKSRSLWIGPDDWNAPSYADISLTNPTAAAFIPLGRRSGGQMLIAGSSTLSTGFGLLAGSLTNYLGSPSPVLQTTYADGTNSRRYTTGTTIGNGAGTRYSGILFTCRGWNPIYKLKFRLIQTGLQRMFAGWTSNTSTDITSDDDPLNLLSGIGLAIRSADTSFQIASNNGSGSTIFTSTGKSIDTAIHTFDLYAQDVFTNKWKWSIDGSAWSELTTTDIPAQSTGLTIMQEITTNQASTAKSIDIFGLYVETD